MAEPLPFPSNIRIPRQPSIQEILTQMYKVLGRHGDRSADILSQTYRGGDDLDTMYEDPLTQRRLRQSHDDLGSKIVDWQKILKNLNMPLGRSLNTTLDQFQERDPADPFLPIGQSGKAEIILEELLQQIGLMNPIGRGMPTGRGQNNQNLLRRRQYDGT